jgi:hypothetical protein
MAKAPATAPGQSLDKKLSVKGLGWDKATILKTVLEDQASEHFLARIVGTATQPRPYKIKEGERAGEIAFGLMGQFEGTNGSTGETITSAVCYLPEYATEMVLGALGAGEDVSAVRIAFDIYAKYDEKAVTSYVFSVRDLLNQGAAGVDEVKDMIKALPMPPKTLALPSA